MVNFAFIVVDWVDFRPFLRLPAARRLFRLLSVLFALGLLVARSVCPVCVVLSGMAFLFYVHQCLV